MRIEGAMFLFCRVAASFNKPINKDAKSGACIGAL